MATKLFCCTSSLNDLGLSGRFDLLTTAGSSLTTGVVNTSASGTNIQWTQTAGGTILEWISPPLAAGFTLATTDTMTFNIWARESSMNANAGGRARVYRVTYGGTVELAGSPWDDGVEFGTAAAAMNWTGTVSSNTTFVENDRILVRYYITNVGTMGGGFTCTIDYNGATDAADGDSWFQLNNNVTFKDETSKDVLQKFPEFPWTGVSPIPGHCLTPDFAWLADGNSTHDSLAPERRRGRHGHVRSGDSGNTLDSVHKTGKGFHLRSQRDRIEFFNNDLLFPASATAMTMVIAARRNQSEIPNVSGGGHWFESNLATDDLRIRYGDGGSTSSLTFAFGGTTLNSGTLSDNAQGDSIWVWTVGSRGMELWRDGLKIASNGSTPTLTRSSNAMFIGSNAGGSDNITVGLLYIFLRQLTPAQIRAVSSVPY